jgi:hypothetical protein
MSEFTEADKAKAISAFTKIIKEDRDKYHAYHDIYHVLKDSCDCRVPEDKILPEKADLLRFLQKKIHDHECHGLVHERLVKLVESLPAVDTIPPAGSHFHRFFTDTEHYNEFLQGHSVLGAEMLPITMESISKKRSREDKEESKKSPKQDKGEKDS